MFFAHISSLLARLLLVSIFLCLCASNHVAAQSAAQPGSLESILSQATPDILPVDEAFPLDVATEAGAKDSLSISLKLGVAPKHYLYVDRFSVVLNGEPLTFDASLHPSKIIDDPYFGKTAIWQKDVAFIFNQRANKAQSQQLTVDYQGCSKAGFCYPPESRTFIAQFDAASNAWTIDPFRMVQSITKPAVAEEKTDHTLQILSFFGIGLLLAFTPCVLPMLPLILALLGRGHLSNHQKLWLGFWYVQGSAITLTLLGLITVSIGYSLQGYFQSSFLLWPITALLIILSALLMSGRNILPSGLQNFWHSLADKFVDQNETKPKFYQAFLLGLFASAIASPCTTGPLAASLLWIAQTGNYVTGGLSMYLLGIGMGVPLIAIAFFGQSLLPKNPAWMQFAKITLAWLMIAFAAYLSWHLLHESVQLLAIFIPVFWFLQLGLQKAGDDSLPFMRGVLTGIGVLLALVLVLENTQIIPKTFTPILRGEPVLRESASHTLTFESINTLDALNSRIERALENNKPVLVDFFAEWCTSCQDYEQITFRDSNVVNALNDFVRIKVDVTTPNPTLMRAYQIYGLPVILLIQPGEPVKTERIDGYLAPEAFLKKVPR